MKMKEAKQMPLHEKFHKFCVDVSTCVAVGGGQFRAFFPFIVMLFS